MMIYKRRTLGEVRWPTTPEFVAVAESWKHGSSIRLLGFVWLAYDRLYENVLSQVDVTLADEDLERSITELLEPEIRRVMTGDEAFYVQHGCYEHESRLSAPAQPPAYDIAFRLYGNPRIMWPLEAKVLRTEGQVADYVSDVNGQFLTCRYAPFSREGGMLGYLVSGDPNRTFDNIAAKVACSLRSCLAFKGRPHRVSDHIRHVPNGKSYPAAFRCHHLMLCLSVRSAA
jgi:hypothetical protein